MHATVLLIRSDCNKLVQCWIPLWYIDVYKTHWTWLSVWELFTVIYVNTWYMHIIYGFYSSYSAWLYVIIAFENISVQNNGEIIIQTCWDPFNWCINSSSNLYVLIHRVFNFLSYTLMFHRKGMDKRNAPQSFHISPFTLFLVVRPDCLAIYCYIVEFPTAIFHGGMCVYNTRWAVFSVWPILRAIYTHFYCANGSEYWPKISI